LKILQICASLRAYVAKESGNTSSGISKRTSPGENQLTYVVKTIHPLQGIFFPSQGSQSENPSSAVSVAISKESIEAISRSQSPFLQETGKRSRGNSGLTDQSNSSDYSNIDPSEYSRDKRVRFRD